MMYVNLRAILFCSPAQSVSRGIRENFQYEVHKYLLGNDDIWVAEQFVEVKKSRLQIK